MLSSIALLVTIEGSKHSCSACADWRANLPSPVTRAISRVDSHEFWQHSESEDPRSRFIFTTQSPENPLGLPPNPPPGETPDQRKQREAHERDLQRDIEMGKRYAAEVDKELKPSEDQAAIERVQRIGGELAKIANQYQVEVTWGDRRLNRFDYVFKVVKGDDVNAFSIPGGFIYVYEGLVNFSESDDELASVLAHEIAHASFRHLATIRRESDKVNWLQLPLLIVAATTRSRDAMNALMAAQLTGQALQSGWSVEAEEAADFGSVQYLVRSRYNPVGGLTFMERLGRRSEFDARPDWGIYRTHPPSQERARSIQGRLRQAGVEIRRSKVSKTFSVQLTSLEDGGIRATFGKTNLHTFRGDGAAERAKQAQAKLNSFFDTVPALFAVKLDGNAVYGGETRLFEVAPEDVPENGDRSSVARRSFEGTRRAVSNLAYSLWSSGAGS